MLWKGAFFSSLVLLLTSGTLVFSQKFVCDGRLLISLTDPVNQHTEVVTPGSEAEVVSFSPVIPSKDIDFNGLGYNPIDNFIYAIEPGSDNIIRLFSDNTYQIVGTESKKVRWSTSAADCSPAGFFVVHNRNSAELLYLNVLDVPDQREFSLQTRVQLQWDPASGNTGKADLEIGDFAFDPKNPHTIYTFQKNRLKYPYKQEPEKSRGTLLKIDGDPESPTFGTVSAIGDGIDENLARTIGALFFDVSGNLYGYASAVIGPIQLDRLIAIDKNTGTARLVGKGPLAIGTDGCSCPYTLRISMQPSTQEAMCQESVAYEITLLNGFRQSISGLEYHHTLPEGMTIEHLSGNLPGTIKAETGEGYNSLILEDVSLPTSEEISFNIQVNVGSRPGEFFHQAELRNAPPELGSTHRSDNAATDIPGDPGMISVKIPDGADSEVHILEADPCVNNTGAIRIADKQIESGTPYFVSYRQDGEEQEPQEVYGNDAQELLLAGLEAGTYSHITVSASSAGGGCAFTLEGPWTINPSPAPLTATLNSNSPVCESGLLQLAADTETSTFYWTGPNNFYSEELNPAIEAATAVQSGYYYFHQPLEACELIDSVEVRVQLPPELNLGPDTVLRTGEEIQLMPVISSDDIATYRWIPDQNISCVDCPSPWVSPHETTEYELQITTQEGCIRSDRIVVEVLEAATGISIPNAFTPNEDGINDVFYPVGQGDATIIIRMDIYNRWGELLFRQQDFPANTESYGWDGTYQGRKVDFGTYLYQLDARLSSGEERTYQGKVHVFP